MGIREVVAQALREEVKQEVVDVAKATLRAAKGIPEHLRDVKKERAK